MRFYFYTPLPWAGAHDSSKAVLAFKLEKKLLMTICRNKGGGTLVSVLAGWDGAQDVLAQTKQPQ